MVEEFWNCFICIAKYLTFLDSAVEMDGGGILDLFYFYCKIPDIIGWWRNFGTVLFALQNILTFLDSAVEEDCMYFNCPCKIANISGC